jgi:hypothetical protein
MTSKKAAWGISILAALSLLSAATDKDSAFIGSRWKYWAFQRVERPPVPAIQNAWIRNPIDAFILQGLEEKKLTPSQPLERTQLLRRVTYDLTGLPPTPAEVTAFLNDKSSRAYEAVIDRLMAAPQYGERWALKWLDVVRWAETNGYELDQDRPHAWRYRDYVINAFNTDKPYDRFIKEQVAGDELFPDSKEALVATGYLRAGSEHFNTGIDLDVARQEVLTEIATNIGQTFLAMTVNCARCHNHKFDPILQSDYYRLQAVFAGRQGKDIEIATAAEKSAADAAAKAYSARLKPVTDALTALAKPYDDKIRAERTLKLEPQLQEALAIPKEKRTPAQQILADNAEAQIATTWDEVLAIMSDADKATRAKLREKLHEIELTEPAPPPTAFALVESGENAPQSYMLRLGDAHSPLDPVLPGVPRVIQAGYEIPNTSYGRTGALANWLASPTNPLTARVMVNRIWQFRIGSGIVRTPNDFGTMGDRPSNQKLLDWLASEFVDGGYSVKGVDRLIVMSNTYQQSSAPDDEKSKIDPDNRLVWRMNRKRFEAEMIRDAALAVSGTLNPQIGGPSVRIPIDPEVYELIFTEHERDGLWPVNPDKNIQNRRGLYLYNKRQVRIPLLAAFDQPDAVTSCPVRPVSTHPLQALSLFNSSFMQEVSHSFAGRLEKSCGNRQGCQIDTAFRLSLSRPPRKEEQELVTDFFKSGGSLPDFCLTLLNRNEFIYVP